MNGLAKSFVLPLLFAGLLFGATNANAVACNSLATGNWGTAGTWSCGHVPLAADDVTIVAGHIITMNSNPGSALSLVINGTANWVTNNRTTNVGIGGVTINAGGDITGTATGVLTSTGGLTINATLTSTTVTITLQTTAAQTISGTGSLARLTVTGAGVTATNTGTLTVTTALAGTGTLSNTGTLNIGGTSAITGLTATAVGNIVNYTGAAAQAIKATTYDTLNTSGAGAKSIAAATIVNNALTVTGGTLTNNSTLTVTTALSGTGGLTNGAAGILNLGGTSAITTLTATAAGNTVNYTGAGQTVKATSYSNLNVSGTATNSGTVTVATALGGGGTLTNAATGILNIGGTSTIAGLTATAAGNIVNYTGAAAQAIKATTYDTLNTSGAGAKSIAAATVVNNALTVTGGTLTNNSTLTVTTALSGTGMLTNGAAGILNLGGTSAITTLTATAVGNSVNYTGTGQTLKVTAYHHLTLSGGPETFGAITTVAGNLTLSGTATATTAAALAIGGNLDVGAGTTLTVGAFNIGVTGTTSVSGVLAHSSATGTKTYTGAVTINSGGSLTNAGNAAITYAGGLVNSGSFASGTAAQIFTNGGLTHNGTAFTAGTGAFTFSTNAQAINCASALSIPSITVTTIAVTNNCNLTVTTALAGTGNFINAATGQLHVNFTGAMGIATLTATAIGNLVDYGFAGAQTVKATTYHHLTLSNSGAKAMGATTINGNFTMSGSATTAPTGAITVGGNFTIGVGTTFTAGALAHSVGGNWNNSGTFTAGTSTVTFNGAAQQTLTGATTFNNMTVNNAAGITINNDVTVSTLLTLTSGAISTGAYKLITSASCPASTSRTGGYVDGKLTLTFPSGTTTCTYHVGSGTNYAPIGVTMVASTGGTLTGSTTGNEHPQVASSGIDATRDVNRYWTLWSSGDTVVASSYSPTFNFVAGDVDALATPANFVLGKYASSAWTLPTPVTAGATSTGVSSIGGPINSVTDFVAGEAAFVCSVPAGSPAGTTCVCDNFNRATLNPSTIYGGNWNVSSSSGTFGLPRIVANKLRLTDNTLSVSTAATGPGTFPAAGNWISVEFKHYAYNGTGADGMALTLSDSTITAVPGAFGGSLGYAQKCQNGVAGCVSDCNVAGGCPGFTGGWVGIAIDEYGNYSNNTEGRLGGPAPGLTLDSVAARGSGSGQTGYPYLGGTATLIPGIDNAASATPAYGYAYRLTVDARNYTWNGTSGTKTAMVSVERDTTGTGTSYTALLPSFDAYVTNPSQANVPANWQLSFTGSTGASTNIHEITGLKICAQTYVPPAGYRILVDNLTPTTCPTDPQPTVTISALNTNGQVITTYTNTVNLAATLASGGGGGASSATWTPYPSNLGTWDAINKRYTFAAGDNGVAKFYLSDLVQQNVYITVSEYLGTVNTSLGTPVQYSSGVASFIVDTTDVLGSGVVAGRAHLMRITRNQAVCGGGINTGFVGAKPLDGWYSPAVGDHPNGAAAPQICAPVGGACLPSYGTCQTLSIAAPVVSASSNNLSLTFTLGVANFCLATTDVGKYSLNLRDDVTVPASPVTGSSAILTARPFAVVVSDVKQGATNNPANNTSGPPVFAKAGTAFQSTVAGYLWNSAGDTGSNGLPGAAADWSAITAAGIAPHYADTVTLAAGVPFAPAAGILSNGSVAVTLGSATQTTLSYNEVGSFTLTATPAISYLNTAGVNLGNRVAIFSNSASTSRNGWVGRFIPDHFALSAMSITNRILSGCAPASTFTYAGEGLQAIFTLEAQNAANSPTANYLTANGYAKLDGTVPANFNFGAIDLAVPPLTATPSMGLTLGTSNGSWTTGGQGTFNANLMANRAATPDGPFESFNLGVDPTDTDGVKLAGYNLDVNNDATNDHGLVGASKIRFGRLKLSNAYGSELLNLPIPIQAQYWNGTSFVINTADSCTTLAANNIHLTTPPAGVIATVGGAFSSGVGSLTLIRPTPAAKGAVGLCVDLGADPVGGTVCSAITSANLPYLQGLWSPGTSYNNDPGARATFGVYRGNSNFIYLRENY